MADDNARGRGVAEDFAEKTENIRHREGHEFDSVGEGETKDLYKDNEKRDE